MPLAQFTDILDALYATYHRREFVAPDPLQFLYEYEDPSDREVVALVASGLAYGRVAQILKSIAAALQRMGPPARFVRDNSRQSMRTALRGFKHRFNTGEELADLLFGLRGLVRRHGSMHQFVAASLTQRDQTVLPALQALAAELHHAAGGPWNHLLCDPSRGGASKRLNLMMRWLCRRDAVDVGDWDDIPPAKLLVPLDVHMHRLCCSMGATTRRAADLKAVLEVTAAFAKIAPLDPVKYDFSLTRLGIRDEMPASDFVRFFESKAGQALNPAGGEL